MARVAVWVVLHLHPYARLLAFIDVCGGNSGWTTGPASLEDTRSILQDWFIGVVDVNIQNQPVLLSGAAVAIFFWLAGGLQGPYE